MFGGKLNINRMSVLTILKKKIKLIFFMCSAVYLLWGAVSKTTRMPAGDGVEYLLMTEAIVNHVTPDVRAEDVDSYISRAEKYGGWKSNPKSKDFDKMKNFVLDSELNFMRGSSGVRVANNGRIYCIHFPTYSYFVAPFKFLLNPFILHPTDVFFIVNALLLLTVLFFLLFVFPVSDWFSLVFSALFLFSTVQWYLLWSHPEIFVACLTVLGLFTFEFKNRFIGVLLCAIASTQYQPLSLLVLVLVVHGVFSEKLSVKNIFNYGLSSCIVILPPLFYFYHYSVTNLVKELGFLDTKYIVDGID